MATKSGASWVPVSITQTRVGTGAEDQGEISYSNDNLARGYWAQILPQLGYTGPIWTSSVLHSGTADEETKKELSDEAIQAIDNFRQQGYDLVRNPQRTDFGSKSITEYGLRLPSGELSSTWEYKGGAWYEQIAPYIGLVLPAVLGIAGTKLGVMPSTPGAAVTVPDVIQSIGANITGQTGNALLNNVVGGAVVGGAKELITSGGDAESAIKGALTAGALAGASGLAQPYIEKAANALSSLTGDEVAQLADTADATAAAADVAGDGGAVEVGGANANMMNLGADAMYGGGYTTSNVAQAYNNLSPEAKNIFDIAVSEGADTTTALIRALSADAKFAAGGFYSGDDTLMNPLAGGGVAVGAATQAPTDTSTATSTPQVDTMSTPTAVTPTERIPTVVTTALPERPLAGTTGLGTAAGVAGAGTVAGGTGITAGTTGGTGLGTSALALGGVLGAGAALGSALPVGSAAAAGSAITPPAAATPTGIPMVDDFLNYLGTPAGALALSAFGSLAGGYFQGQAISDASRDQATAAQNALKLQQDMFDYQKSLLDPYQKAGKAALDRLTGTMGLGGTGSPQQMLEMDPGYAFRLGEGMKALERVQAARGNMLSGGAIKAGQRYAQDVASQEYGNAYNRLSNIAGLGQTAGTQLGAAGQQFGQTAGSAMGDVANSLAAGRVGRTSAYTQGIGGAVNAYTDYFNRQQQNQLFRDIYGRTIGG